MPRRLPLVILAMIVVLTGASKTSADTVLQQITHYQDAIQSRLTELERNKPDDKDKNRQHQYSDETSHLRGGLIEWQTARQDTERGIEDETLRALDRIQKNAQLPKEYTDAAASISAQLRAERATRLADFTAKVDAVRQRAGAAIIKAKAAGDLDATIQELSHAADNAGPPGFPGLPTSPFDDAFAKVNDARKRALGFATRWQDCLAAIAAHDSARATVLLNTLAMEQNDTAQALGVPRSEILARIPSQHQPEAVPGASPSDGKPDPVDELISRIKTPDDLPQAVREMTDLDHVMFAHISSINVSKYQDEAWTLQALQKLQQTAAALQDGMDHPLWEWLQYIVVRTSLRAEPKLAELRRQLGARVLPRALGLPDSEKPLADEPLSVFLDRAVEDARERQDWRAVARGLQARRLLASNREPSAAMTHEPLDLAFKQFFAAQNFEQAQQFDRAVTNYLAALGSGLQDIPVAFIASGWQTSKRTIPRNSSRGGTRHRRRSRSRSTRRKKRHPILSTRIFTNTTTGIKQRPPEIEARYRRTCPDHPATRTSR